jgi:hypothetical protein
MGRKASTRGQQELPSGASPQASKGCSLICVGIALRIEAVLPQVQRSTAESGCTSSDSQAFATAAPELAKPGNTPLSG